MIAEMDNGAEELPPFLAHVNRLFTVLAARSGERDRGTFAASYYLPFFAELKAKNYVEPFVYWAIQRAPVAGVGRCAAERTPDSGVFGVHAG